MYSLDAAKTIPLHIQLYEVMKEEITVSLEAGAKLPSIRKLAQMHNISNTTVENAYSQLYAEGYIESRPKSGYYVSDLIMREFPSSVPQRAVSSAHEPRARYDFFPARLDKESFPLKLWKRLFNKVIDETVDFGAYSDPQGEWDLRMQIADYLKRSRAVNCTPEQIVVTGAFMDAIGMVADMLRSLESDFAIEHPGYHIARKAFEHYGYKVHPIAVGQSGIDVKALTHSGARIVYITPSHQYPTGVAMPVANRQRLLEWARKVEGYIIEDDYDSEMTYRTRPIPSLQGLDCDDRVIYMGTFSKSLSPALRVGYTVLPQRLYAAYAQYHRYFPRVSLTVQKCLEVFMREGHWERHLRRVRNDNRRKHDRMLHAIEKYLGSSFEVVSKGGGLAINIRPVKPMDLDAIQKEAEKEGVRLYLAKENSGGEWQALRMGFGGFIEAEIEAAVKVVKGLVERHDKSRPVKG